MTTNASSPAASSKSSDNRNAAERIVSQPQDQSALRKQVLISMNVLDGDTDAVTSSPPSTVKSSVKRNTIRQHGSQPRYESTIRKRVLLSSGVIDDGASDGNATVGADEKVDDRVQNRENTVNSPLVTSPSTELQRNDHLFSQVGAFAIRGIEESGDPGLEVNMVNYASVTEEPAARYSPEVFDAHLATELRPTPTHQSNENTENALVVDAVHDIDPINQKRSIKRAQWIVALIIVIIVAVIGSVVGAILNRINIAENETPQPTPIPTGAPTTHTEQDEALRSFLSNAIAKTYGSDQLNANHELALEWIILKDPLQVKEFSNKLVERFALVLFYFETTMGGTRFWKNCNPPIGNEIDVCIDNTQDMRWLTGTDQCLWFGIRCSETMGGVLNTLFLVSNGLVGTIPSSILLIPYICRLFLGDNNFEGSIPEAMYDLTHLQSFETIYNPSITGTISTRVGLLTDLETFWFANNALTGTIPSELGNLSKLVWLALGENELSGLVPESIFELFHLRYLSLEQLSLTGTLSTKFGQLTALDRFLGHNSMIHGPIPSEVGLCTKLTTFHIYSNEFSGQIPSEIGMLSDMNNIAFGFNAGISGTIPDELYNLTNLLGLEFLGHPHLRGTISTNIGRLSNLLYVQISDTSLSGYLPTEIGMLSNGLNWLFIQKSNFVGSIPSEVGSLQKLTTLQLNEMAQINGTIPEDLFRLRLLGTLVLQYLSLSGTISTLVGELSKLTFVSFSVNPLTGYAQTEIGKLSDLERLYLSGTKLSGSVPKEICELGISGSLRENYADCSPSDNPPMPCECCTVCYNRETGEFDKMEA